jgi:hypothetical protein
LRKVHTAESLVEIAHLRNLLEAEGIACTVRNDRLGGVAGEIPFLECWPELWIAEHGLLLRARALIEEALRASPARDDWRCPRCAEMIEAQFEICWNCGEAHEAG